MENVIADCPPWTPTEDCDGGTEIVLILTPFVDNLDENNNAVGPGFTENLELATVVAYTILVLSVVGNITVFVGMPFKINERDPLCTLHILLRNLVAADLLVTAFFLPKQMNWINMGDFTYGESFPWYVADAGCRVVAFLSSLGLYVSGFLIVSITLDRCLAVRKRTITSKAVRRAKIMSWAAWAAGVVFSGIEAAVHHLEYHHFGKEMLKCTFLGTFQSWAFEFAYASMERVLSFGFPFLMILLCYPCLLWQTCRAPLDIMSTENGGTNGRRRAGQRTMKLSATVVFLFFICWAPYNIMYLWASVDRRFYFRVPPELRMTLRLLAIANSSLNPLVYGYYYIVK